MTNIIICKLIRTNTVISIAASFLVLSIIPHIAIAKNNDFEKVIENGKTIYKKKAEASRTNNNKQKIKEKVKVDMYLSHDCKKKCVNAMLQILDYDNTLFLRKNIHKNFKFKKELIKLSGNDKTPKIFINGKEMKNISPAVIEFELRKAGAKRKPPIKLSDAEQSAENEAEKKRR